MIKYFKIFNGVHTTVLQEVDFVITDDNDEMLDETLPQHVLDAIQVLNDYADSI